MAESTDGGETWQFTSGAGWPAGGVSWFPFFVETRSRRHQDFTTGRFSQ